MSADIFIDTNVFIYHLDASEPRKHKIAERVVRSALSNADACISFQVIQECLNTVMRKARVRLDSDAARRYLDNVLAPLMQVPASVGLYHSALDLQGRFRFSFYDSLIVAAALSAGCKQLYSEDMQHGQRVGGTLTITNPFAS